MQRLLSLICPNGLREAWLWLVLVLEVVLSPCFSIEHILFLWLILLSGSDMGVTANPDSGALLREQDRALSILGYDVIWLGCGPDALRAKLFLQLQDLHKGSRLKVRTHPWALREACWGTPFFSLKSWVWSVLNLWPYKNWFNFFTPKIMARATFSIVE